MEEYFEFKDTRISGIPEHKRRNKKELKERNYRIQMRIQQSSQIKQQNEIQLELQIVQAQTNTLSKYQIKIQKRRQIKEEKNKLLQEDDVKCRPHIKGKHHRIL